MIRAIRPQILVITGILGAVMLLDTDPVLKDHISKGLLVLAGMIVGTESCCRLRGRGKKGEDD